jgi:hypothetical protein
MSVEEKKKEESPHDFCGDKSHDISSCPKFNSSIRVCWSHDHKVNSCLI